MTSAISGPSRASTPLDELLSVQEGALCLVDSLAPEDLSLGAPGAGTVGAQLRHCLEFPTRLLVGRPEGKVDYDRRERREDLERDLESLSRAFSEVEGQLRSLDGVSMDEDLRVRHDVTVDREGEWSRTTFGRELRFVCSHAIHHLALVALILRSNGRDPGENLGVAPSTLAHRRKTASCAP